MKSFTCYFLVLIYSLLRKICKLTFNTWNLIRKLNYIFLLVHTLPVKPIIQTRDFFNVQISQWLLIDWKPGEKRFCVKLNFTTVVKNVCFDPFDYMEH